ncbi:hypothetical protein KF728_27330 [Candidatus Obscuribacterales bacterium]|nr:hypothetical protein [Candidatus Obscuribacterales bacterium]
MKSTDSQGRNLLATGKIALAGTLLLAGPAFANENRTSFRDFRDANPGLDRQELRQMFRAERRDHVQQIRDARGNAGGANGPRFEYTPVVDDKFVIQPIVTPIVPRFETQTTFVTDKGRTRNVSKGLKLDLTADTRSIVLGDNLFSNASSYTVNVGGEQKVLTSGSKVTAAEFVALQQVIDGDAQSLVVDGSGRGVDGSFNLGSIDNAGRNIKASSLTISEGVEAIGNFGRNSDFKVTRELVNYGSMYALTSNAANNKANIGARDVTNSGSITTQAPDAVASANGAVDAPIDLRVSADRDLNNLGSISSNGTVTLSAGGTLANSGSVSAQSDVTLLSSVVVNNGSISSTGGNVNFDTASPASISVNNTGGTINALNGAINFRQAGFTEKVDTTLSGGDWYSQTLNLNGGDGHVNVSVGDLTGVVNTYAGTASVNATSTLNIGETVTSGDPLFESGGDLNVGASQTTGGGPLTYIATGNINIASGLSFNTSNTGDGGDILFIAGAAHTGTGPLTVTGASATGGAITFTGTAPIFNASSSAANGGDITFAAFEGTTPGVINLGGATTITSTGANGFSDGTVSMFANSITTGAINVSGAGTNNAAGTGNILLAGGQPQIVGTLSIDATGTVTSGSLAPGSTTGSSVTATSTLNARNSVTVSADSTNVQNSSVTAGSYAVTSGGTIQLGNPIVVSGSLTLLTTQNIDIRSNIVAPGGIVMVAGEAIEVIAPNPTNPIISASAAGQGGNIAMVSGAAFTQTATTVTITGASNASDNAAISLTFGLSALDTRGTGLNANGGNINLVAFASSNNTASGGVYTDSVCNITTGGTGSGSNGNLVVVAGRNDGGVGIGLSNGVNTSGAANNGSGDVTLHTKTPATGAVISKVNGGLSTGTFLGGATVNGGISSGSGSTIITNGGDIDILSGRTNSNSAIDLGTVTAQTGTVRINASGSAADVQLRTMQGGSIVVTATQDINIRGGLGWNTVASGGGGILAVAGRDIINIDSGTDFDTSPGASPQAGSISFIAGALFSEALSSLTITGPSSTGGNVSFGNNVDVINANGIGTSSGGQINLIAYADGTGQRGTVFVDSTADVNSQGGATGSNGEIIVMAGNNQGGNGINVGGVWTTEGGTSGTGNVSLLSAQPINGAVLSKVTGAYTSVGFTNGAVQANNNINGINSNLTMNVDHGAALTMSSGNTLTLTNTSLSAGRIRLSAVGEITGLQDLTTFGNGTVVATSQDNVTLRGDIVAPGGVVLVAGRAINAVTAGTSINTSTATGSAGDVVLVAGATFTQNLVNVTITGSSNLDSVGINLGNSFDSIDTRSLGGNGAGGDVTLLRMASSGNFTFGIGIQGGGTSILTGGNGTGANGNITAIGAGNGINAISIDAAIDTTGGATGTGDVLFQTTAPNNATIIKSNAGVSGFLGGAINDASVFQSNGQGGITMAGGTLTVNAGAGLQMQGVTNTGGSVQYNAGTAGNTSAIANIKGITADSISVTSQGKIDMRGGDMVGVDGILFVAGENIENNGGGMKMTTAGSTGTDRGDITLVAGATFTQNASSVTITGNTTNAGGISLGNGFLGFDTHFTAGVGNAGAVNLVGYAGTGGGNGYVFADSGSFAITAGGSGSGSNGDVLVIGSADNGSNAINLSGTIDISGGATGSGSVSLKTIVPGTGVVLSRTTGGVSSGSFETATTRSSNIRLTGANAIVTDGSDVEILSGRNVQITSISTTPDSIGKAGAISIETNGPDTLQIGAGGNNSISSLSFNGGLVSGAGGDLTVLARGVNGVQINGSVLQQNQNTGDGGNITIDADQGTMSFANGPVVIEASGEGATAQDGGSITLRANSYNFNGLNVDLRANASVGGGTAGSVTIESNGALTNILGAGANQFEVQVGTSGQGGLLVLDAGTTIALNSAISVDQLTLSAGSGITQTAGAIITADLLTVNSLTGLANLNADNAVNTLFATGGGALVFKNNASTALELGSLGITQSLDLTALAGVTVIANISTSGDIDVSTTVLTAQADMTANSIDVSSPIGAGGLTVDGSGGNRNFNATGVGQLVRFTANDGDLSLGGTQTYISEAEMNVIENTGSLNVLTGADIEGLQTLTLNSSRYDFAGSIVGNPLIFRAPEGVGTIANSQGDVTLSGDVILNGNFAIIAQGNVNFGSATTINLGGGASGGALTVLAGFSFTPSTGGQVGPVGNEAVTYSSITPSAIGGNINLSDVTVNTAGGLGAGGNVTLIASDGTQSAGSISVGAIDASGATDGGDILIIGPGNISVGGIDASGTNGGSVLISTTAPTVVGTPSILNGELSGGSFTTGGASLDKKSGALVVRGGIDASGTGGSINLTSNYSKNFAIGASKTPKNGVQGSLTASNIEVLNVRSGVQLDSSAGILSAQNVKFTAGGKGTLLTGKNVVLTTVNNLTLIADTGAIGKKSFVFQAASVGAETSGNVNLTSQRATPLVVNDSSAGGSFTLTTAAGVTLNDIDTAKGSISVTAATGGLTVNDGSVITANNGALTLINTDITTGNINLGANTVIETQGKGKDVNIAIGAPPKKPTNTTPPSGVTVNNTGKGLSYFSQAGGFTVVGSNETRGTNKDVIINNGSANPSTQKIIFGGNVVVEADPPSRSAAAVMPSLLAQPATETFVASDSASLNLSSANSSIGSTFNSQHISPLPTDLLSTVSNTAQAEASVVGLSSAVQTSEAVSTACDYLTDAYVWSDEDLGLGSATMLSGSSANSGISGSTTGVTGTGVTGTGNGSASGVTSTEVAKLRQGTIVLAPAKDTRIETPIGTIEVSKGSVALVVLDGTRLGVYDLHDERKGSVRVTAGARATTLSPGRCTVLTTRSNHGFERVNPMESVGYKSVAAVNHGNGIKAFNAEFATMHAIGSVKPLKEIMSSRHDNARRMSNKLMKTSAVLMHLGGIGEFEVYAEPSVAAMAR